MHFYELIVAVVLIVAAAYTATTVFRLVGSLWGGGDHHAEMAVFAERLAKLEASMENMSAETQRLADGHRFFTDLLVNRSAPPALASGKPATPSNQNGSR
jgi:hypothetical protein